MKTQKTFWILTKDEKSKCTLSLFDGEDTFSRMSEKFLTYNKKQKLLSAIFREESAEKTNPQLRYYWGYLLICICDEMNNLGNEFELKEANEVLKDMFYNEEIYVQCTNKIIKMPESLAGAGKERMAMFIDKCYRFGKFDLGIQKIHTPEEYFAIIKEGNEKNGR